MIETTWADIKGDVDTDALSLQYSEKPDRFDVWINDRNISKRTILWKAGASATGIPGSNASDLSEFETNYKAQANSFVPPEFSIREEDKRTGGNFQARGLAADVPAGVGWSDLMTFSWPFPISVLAAETQVDTEHHRDMIEFHIGPDTIVGTLTANSASGDTVLDVQKSVIDNVSVGKFIKISDGAVTDDCGRVIAVDRAALQITVETATTNTFAAATPTYVKATSKMIYDVELLKTHRLVIGESKIGASYIPANTDFVLKYNNVDGLAKRFAFIVEYLY